MEGEQWVRQLSQQSEHWSAGIGLVRLFPEAMREQFDSWLQRPLQKNAPCEIGRFAQGLCRDLDAAHGLHFTMGKWPNRGASGETNRILNAREFALLTRGDSNCRVPNLLVAVRLFQLHSR